MSQWVRGFVIRDVAEVHALFQKCIRDAERLVALEREARKNVGGARALAELEASYSVFNQNLRGVAERGAANARKGMVERLEGHRVRPATGSIPPLKDLVDARPLPPLGRYQTGAVGVGDIQLLERAINPHSRGYGSYWRAQEYGTGQGEVPSQVGRVLYGSFTGPGGTNPTAPDAQYAGGGGPHPIFLPRRPGALTSLNGERTIGLGTIGKEIQAKHFIKFGADSAEIEWRQGVAQAQDRALQELRAIRLARS